MKFGTNFRLPSLSKLNSVVKQIAYDLDLFTYKVAVSYNKPIMYFNKRKCLVKKNFSLNLKIVYLLLYHTINLS